MDNTDNTEGSEQPKLFDNPEIISKHVDYKELLENRLGKFQIAFVNLHVNGEDVAVPHAMSLLKLITTQQQMLLNIKQEQVIISSVLRAITDVAEFTEDENTEIIKKTTEYIQRQYDQIDAGTKPQSPIINPGTNGKFKL